MSHSPVGKKILVVEDDPSTCELLASSLALEGYSVDKATGSAQADQLLRGGDYTLVISDIYLDELTGLDLQRTLQDKSPGTKLILMTAHATLETAVRAVQEGAFDYLSKPFELEDLFRVVRRALEPARHTRAVARDPGETASLSSMIIGRSTAMADVYKRVARVAGTDSSVWISGESGTGKELVAQAIHKHSRRGVRPFVAINCGALAETLLESELFGHVKGAFTGAHTGRDGLFESAAEGTLFLDEITETALSFQVRLLRLLQEGEYRPVGSNVARKADVRILAASNLDVADCIREGKFREDLYYRLAAFTIHIPPLRERTEDLPLLVAHFLEQLSRTLGRAVSIAPSALKMLAAYDWPGNVRQLRNALEKLAILSPDAAIRNEDVEHWLDEIQWRMPESAGSEMPHSLTYLEKERIRKVLWQCQGNKSRAAALLGIDRSTLYRKMEAYGISQPSSSPSNPHRVGESP
ncbi:MAG: sigma-54-dependent Fis family transcriptional regulator [Acidobacteria bacterium]|nr:sigma-54-dependent Fis family transcriptional regulator [Acidobacteriota bacterium]